MDDWTSAEFKKRPVPVVAFLGCVPLHQQIKSCFTQLSIKDEGEVCFIPLLFIVQKK